MSVAELRAAIPRLTAKLNEENFAEALKIADANKKLAAQIVPIRAYIHYRLGDYSRVIELYQALSKPAQLELGILHLMAQTHYKVGLKSGDFKSASQFYSEIASRYPEHAFQSAEYIVNALATYINAGDVYSSHKLLQQLKFDTTNPSSNPLLYTYEALFNISFTSLQTNHLDSALQHAESAYQQFQTALDQEDQDASEAALLQYHIAYLRYLQSSSSPQNPTAFHSTNTSLMSRIDNLSGSIKSILELNSVILKFQSASMSSIVVKNNEKTTDLVDQLRNLQKQYQDKLSRFQLATIQYNLATFSSLQRSADKPQLTKLIQTLPIQKSTTEPGLKPLHQQPAVQSLTIVNPQSGSPIHKDWLVLTLSLYSLLKDKEFAKVDELFENFFNNLAPHLSTQPQLLEYYTNAKLSQLFVSIYRHNITAAISQLQTFVQDPLIQSHLRSTAQLPQSTSLEQAPAISALFIALYEELKDFPQCAKAIDNAIKFSSTRSTSSAENTRALSQLRIKSATIKASAGDYQGAITALEQLASQCNKSTPSGLEQHYHYVSQIVTLCSQHLPQQVEKYAAMLPDPDLSGLDISSLVSKPLEVDAANNANIKQQQVSAATTTGKPKFSPEKLAQVRRAKKLAQFKRKGPLLPKNVTMEQYLAAKGDNFSKVDQYRWKPKWERPQTQKGKKGQTTKQLSRGPQGSGISENKVETNVATDTSKASETKEKVQQHLRNQKNNKKGRR